MREEVCSIKEQYVAVNNITKDSEDYRGQTLVNPRDEAIETYDF